MNATTSKFSYDKATKTFTAFITDLAGKADPFHQLYQDACDIGLVLVSHVTGRSASYFLSSQEKDEGDVVCFKLQPTSETLRSMPQLRGTSITIYND